MARQDFPEVTCESCYEAMEVDQVPLPCQDGGGCLIPSLTMAGERILEMRSLLMGLHDLVDPGTILKIFGVVKEELIILATIEKFIQDLNPPKTPEV